MRTALTIAWHALIIGAITLGVAAFDETVLKIAQRHSAAAQQAVLWAEIGAL